MHKGKGTYLDGCEEEGHLFSDGLFITNKFSYHFVDMYSQTSMVRTDLGSW